MAPKPPVTITKASYDLQRRVGSGPLDPAVITRCQNIINSQNVDFVPVAHEYLAQLEQVVRSYRQKGHSKKLLDHLSRPVMELKANGRMFHYDLITHLANIMLGFLEMVIVVDDDVIDVVIGHTRSLEAILDRKMTGDGGPYGVMLASELKEACHRYFDKHHLKPRSLVLA